MRTYVPSTTDWCPGGLARLPLGPQATELRGLCWFVVQHTCTECGRHLHRLVVNSATGEFVVNRHKPPKGATS